MSLFLLLSFAFSFHNLFSISNFFVSSFACLFAFFCSIVHSAIRHSFAFSTIYRLFQIYVALGAEFLCDIVTKFFAFNGNPGHYLTFLTDQLPASAT